MKRRAAGKPKLELSEGAADDATVAPAPTEEAPLQGAEAPAGRESGRPLLGVYDADRGVYELEISPPGTRSYHIVDSCGDVAFMQYPAHWVTRAWIRGLWSDLDARDPVDAAPPVLALVK